MVAPPSARSHLLDEGRKLLACRDQTEGPKDVAQTLALAFDYVTAVVAYLEAEGAIEAIADKAGRID